MLRNVKFSYNPDTMSHELSFDDPCANLDLALWDLAEENRVPIRGFEHADLDGTRGEWTALWNGYGLGILVCDGIVTLCKTARFDALDGTNPEPVDSETVWAEFVPVCRDLLTLAAEIVCEVP